MGKAAKVTRADVDASEEALIAALETCRSLVAKYREGKVAHDRVKESKAAVEQAEADHLWFVRSLGEQNVGAAAAALDCEVEWGRPKSA